MIAAHPEGPWQQLGNTMSREGASSRPAGATDGEKGKKRRSLAIVGAGCGCLALVAGIAVAV